MSSSLISRSPDLLRLRHDGYDLEVRGGLLLVKHIPYVTTMRHVAYGILVTNLDLAGDITTRPGSHVVEFAGEAPCNEHGQPLDRILNGTADRQLADGLTVNFTFSSKPPEGYADYHAKITAYADLLAGPAETIDPDATARTFPVVLPDAGESVFRYNDTASSRSRIDAVSEKLNVERVAIVGLGGTGSYILDLVAKTPVREIHLYDGDTFSQHNAFRAPGAASIEALTGRPAKVSYLAQLYSQMHTGIVEHPYHLDEANAGELAGCSFVFLALDAGRARPALIATLEALGVSFIDVGLGVDEVDGALGGILRVTTSTPELRAHVHDRQRIPLDGGGPGDYATNIQVADLNALNATLAVIKWKKLCGFYHDLSHEHFATYTIDGNQLTNEERP